MSRAESVSKFDASNGPHPMLSRDADSIYWMSRYVERAEHVARVLMVNSNLLTDVGDLAPGLRQRQWQHVLGILRMPDLPHGDGPVAARMAYHMSFNPDNPDSLTSCLTRARENARGIRENISAEMWESLNTLYWFVRGDDAAAKFDESPDDFCRQIMAGSMLFQGLTDQTLAHEQPWMFAQLAKFLERIDVTCRVLETNFTVLKATEKSLETPLRNIHWMAVLRSCCSIEAYRRHNVGDMDPLRVAEFLILQRDFPRSIGFSVRHAHDAITRIRSAANPHGVDPAERILGRLHAQLEFAEMPEILAESIPTYLQRIQTATADAAMALHKTYFLH